MGVSYTAILAIGKEFDDEYEAKEFLQQHGFVSTEEDEEIIDEDGLSEWLYGNDEIDGEGLNAYSGYGFYVGYTISCRTPEQFQNSFTEGMERWNKLFPDVVPDVIHTVKVY